MSTKEVPKIHSILDTSFITMGSRGTSRIPLSWIRYTRSDCQYKWKFSLFLTLQSKWYTHPRIESSLEISNPNKDVWYGVGMKQVSSSLCR